MTFLGRLSGFQHFTHSYYSTILHFSKKWVGGTRKQSFAQIIAEFTYFTQLFDYLMRYFEYLVSFFQSLGF